MENNSKKDSILNQLKKEEIIIKHNSKSILDQLKDEDLNISNKLVKYKKDEVVNPIVKKKDIVEKEPYPIVKSAHIQKLAMGELKDSFRNLGVGFINGGIFGATENKIDKDPEIYFFDMNLREIFYAKGLTDNGKEIFHYNKKKPDRLISYNNRLVAKDKDNILYYFSINKKGLKLEDKIMNTNNIYSIDFTINKNFIYGILGDKIYYKNFEDIKRSEYREDSDINSIVVSEDNNGLLAAVDNHIKLYDIIEDKKEIRINERLSKKMSYKIKCIGAGSNFIAATQGKDILILNEKLDQIEKYSSNSEIDKMVVDSNYILTADRNNNIHLYLVNNK